MKLEKFPKHGKWQWLGIVGFTILGGRFISVGAKHHVRSPATFLIGLSLLVSGLRTLGAQNTKEPQMRICFGVIAIVLYIADNLLF